MSASPATYANGLPAFTSGSRAVGWWGIVLLVVIEVAVFSTFIVSYFYLYSGASVWPLGDIDPPKLFLPVVNASILFSSVIPAYLAERAIRSGDQMGLRIGYMMGAVMLAVFVTLKVVEYNGYDYHWDTNAYGSIVWTITGFHTAHVIAVLLKTLTLLVLAWKGYFHERRFVAVQGNTIYWLFVAIIWVPLFATLYIFPRLI
jgi:cytochrome c oxidase subunit III